MDPILLELKNELNQVAIERNLKLQTRFKMIFVGSIVCLICVILINLFPMNLSARLNMLFPLISCIASLLISGNGYLQAKKRILNYK